MRIAIAGASGVGISIAHELVSSGHTVFVLDRHKERLHPELVPEAKWVEMDVCEVQALEQLHLNECDCVVAATGDDKANLVLSLLAKTEFGVPRVVARVNDARNEWCFTEDWGVDEVVSTPQLLASVVEQVVNVGELVRLLPLRRNAVDIVGMELPRITPLAGKQIRRLNFPPGASLVSIIRGERVIVPQDHDALEPGDDLIFVATRDAHDALRDLLQQS